MSAPLEQQVEALAASLERISSGTSAPSAAALAALEDEAYPLLTRCVDTGAFALAQRVSHLVERLREARQSLSAPDPPAPESAALAAARAQLSAGAIPGEPSASPAPPQDVDSDSTSNTNNNGDCCGNGAENGNSAESDNGASGNNTMGEGDGTDLVAAAALRASAGVSEDTRVLAAGPPDIPASEIQLGVKIGTGSYGTVYKGRVRGKLVAVKVPNQQTLSAEQARVFRHEMSIMKKIFHQNVVLFLGACTAPGQLMIVTELMFCDLEHLIHGRNRPRLGLAQKLRIAQDAAYGVNWLHGICHIVHRDLKPANILLDENLNVKVTDVGFSAVFHDGAALHDAHRALGTLLYMAPEVMLMRDYDASADIYALGLILYELATERELFADYTEVRPFVRAITEDRLRPPLAALGPAPPSLAALVEQCWADDPRARPACPEVIERLDAAIVDAATSFTNFISPSVGATVGAVPAVGSLAGSLAGSLSGSSVGALGAALSVPVPGIGAVCVRDLPAESEAGAFWRSLFVRPFQPEVPWSVFEAVVARSLGVAPFQLERLRDHLAAPSAKALRTPQLYVSLENFNKYYLWFGNFFAGPAAHRALRELNLLLAAPYFHGAITNEEAQSRLSTQGDGTFLVRLSSSSPLTHPFTISKVRNGVPVHKRIARTAFLPGTPGRFTTPMSNGSVRAGSTVNELIKTLRAEGNLGSPCPKNVSPISSYGSLFSCFSCPSIFLCAITWSCFVPQVTCDARFKLPFFEPLHFRRSTQRLLFTSHCLFSVLHL